MTKLLESCARDLMDTAPKIMQVIRLEMRRGHAAELSVPQFRALRFIQRNPDSSLSDLADHLGLTPPSVSKLVDGLVKKELIKRQEAIDDRRKLMLVLTQNGTSIINAARASAQAHLIKILGCLSNEELTAINTAMELLQPLFASQNIQQTATQ